MLSEAERRLTYALLKPESQRGQEHIQGRLSQIIRYKGLEMIHPSNVANHQAFVVTIALMAANQWAEDMGMLEDIKPATVIRLAAYHDTHEADPQVGDIPASDKDDMTIDQKAELKEREEDAHRRLATDFYGLKLDSLEYQQYMQDKHDLENLSTLEAESTKIGDTLHATWEALHECLAGNTSFFPVLERYKRVCFKLAERSALWKKIQSHSDIQLSQDLFPTPKQVSKMPQITKEQVNLVNGEEPATWNAFLKTMRNPQYPVWYRTELNLTLLTYGIDGTAKVIFPNWRRSFYEE